MRRGHRPRALRRPCRSSTAARRGVRMNSRQSAVGSRPSAVGRQRPLRIAHVAPVATSIPPPRSGSVETMTSLLTEGLVARGHDVTLFATANSKTAAKLHATYPRGYNEDADMWPWELHEMLNLAAAVERANA